MFFNIRLVVRWGSGCRNPSLYRGGSKLL